MSAADARPRVALVDEAVHGHTTLMNNLRRALGPHPAIEPQWLTVPPPAGLERALVAPLPHVGDADLQPVRWRLRYSWRTVRLVRAAAPDAVFVNTQSCAMLGAQRTRRPPWVVSVDLTHRQFARHEVWRPRNRFSPAAERVNAALEQRAYRRAYRVVAWTDWAAASLRDDYGVPPERIATLHVGVDARRYGAIERGPRPPGQPLRVLFIGNLARMKGLDVLQEALAGAEHPAELDVITGDELPPHPLTSVHHGVQESSPRFLELLGAADLFVFPTRADAVPWVVLEAMASGLPVISTAVGAIPEMLGDAGLVVARDARAVRAAFDALAADEPRRLELGRRARRRVAERYDAWTQAPRLVEILRAAAASVR
jgi:glycosyltransferase involved in cell wall biosynthesis